MSVHPRFHRALRLVPCIALLLPALALADGPWAAGLDGGFGALDGKLFRGADATPLRLDFHLHYRLHDRWRVGVAAGGWTLESSDVNEPSRGAGVSEVLFTLEARPFADPRVWLEAGAGAVNYWSQAPGDRDDHGTAWQLRAGHALVTRGSTRLGPFVGFDGGDGSRVSHRGWAIGLRAEWAP